MDCSKVYPRFAIESTERLVEGRLVDAKDPRTSVIEGRTLSDKIMCVVGLAGYIPIRGRNQHSNQRAAFRCQS